MVETFFWFSTDGISSLMSFKRAKSESAFKMESFISRSHSESLRAGGKWGRCYDNVGNLKLIIRVFTDNLLNIGVPLQNVCQREDLKNNEYSSEDDMIKIQRGWNVPEKSSSKYLQDSLTPEASTSVQSLTSVAYDSAVNLELLYWSTRLIWIPKFFPVDPLVLHIFEGESWTNFPRFSWALYQPENKRFASGVFQTRLGLRPN